MRKTESDAASRRRDIETSKNSIDNNHLLTFQISPKAEVVNPVYAKLEAIAEELELECGLPPTLESTESNIMEAELTPIQETAGPSRIQKNTGTSGTQAPPSYDEATDGQNPAPTKPHRDTTIRPGISRKQLPRNVLHPPIITNARRKNPAHAISSLLPRLLQPAGLSCIPSYLPLRMVCADRAQHVLLFPLHYTVEGATAYY